MHCPICQSVDNRRNGWVVEDVEFLECAHCGFIFLPRPISIQLEKIYTADYAKLRGHDLINSPIHASKVTTAGFYFKKISMYGNINTMIDVGCSTGANVAKGVELGWQCCGMDINIAALETARSYIPKAEFFSSLKDQKLTGRQFDLLTLFDVIEHIEDLDSFMIDIDSRLNSQGLLFILTPNANSLSAKLMQNQWPHLFSEHISLFSEKNLTKFLEKYQYRVLEKGFAWKFVSLQGLYRHVACHSQGILSKIIKFFLSPFKNSKMILPFNIGETYIIAQKHE